MCRRRFKHVISITMHSIERNNSSRFASNSEAFASELLVKLADMSPRYLRSYSGEL